MKSKIIPLELIWFESLTTKVLGPVLFVDPYFPLSESRTHPGRTMVVDDNITIRDVPHVYKSFPSKYETFGYPLNTCGTN